MKGTWSQNLQFFFQNCFSIFFLTLQTILMCTVGELARGSSVAVAAGVSDMWQVIGDTRHMKHDTWPLTHDTYFFCIIINFYFYCIGATIRHIRRFSVSCMRDFLFFISPPYWAYPPFFFINNIYIKNFLSTRS